MRTAWSEPVGGAQRVGKVAGCREVRWGPSGRRLLSSPPGGARSPQALASAAAAAPVPRRAQHSGVGRSALQLRCAAAGLAGCGGGCCGAVSVSRRGGAGRTRTRRTRSGPMTDNDIVGTSRDDPTASDFRLPQSRCMQPSITNTPAETLREIGFKNFCTCGGSRGVPERLGAGARAGALYGARTRDGYP